MKLKIPPGGGTTWSKSFGLVLFQIFLITALSSAFASSMFPSVLILSDVLTTANRVALKRTVPSLFNGMFIETSLWKTYHRTTYRSRIVSNYVAPDFNYRPTLQATLCGQSLPKPKGGDIFRSSVTTSRCLIRPFASGSYSDHKRMNSSKWCGPNIDQSLVK